MPRPWGAITERHQDPGSRFMESVNEFLGVTPLANKWLPPALGASNSAWGTALQGVVP